MAGRGRKPTDPNAEKKPRAPQDPELSAMKKLLRAITKYLEPLSDAAKMRVLSYASDRIKAEQTKVETPKQ